MSGVRGPLPDERMGEAAPAAAAAASAPARDRKRKRGAADGRVQGAASAAMGAAAGLETEGPKAKKRKKVVQESSGAKPAEPGKVGKAEKAEKAEGAEARPMVQAARAEARTGGATAGDIRAAGVAAPAAAAAAAAPSPEQTEKKMRAAVGRVPLPSPLWGKVGAFLTKKEAVALSKERSLAGLVPKRGQRKGQAAAGAAGAVGAASTASITDAEKAALRADVRGFTAKYWPEAVRGDFATQLVQALITRGAPIPYTFPAQFGESARRQVHQLSLERDITPDILRELHRCFPNLQSLIIKITCITDLHLQEVAQWAGLQNLNFGLCDAVTDKGLECLKGLSHLHSVELRDCHKMTSVGFGHLTSLSNLRHLHVPYSDNVDDAWLDQLAACPHLLSLHLGKGHTVTDAGVAKIAGLTELRSVSLGNFGHVTDQGYAPLAGLARLERLTVVSDTFNVTNLKSFLPALAHLRHLTLNPGNSINDELLEYLATQRQLRDQLESLNFNDCTEITAKGLAHLASFTRLRDLDLKGARRDNMLETLHLLRSVKNLNFYEAHELTGKGLASLGRCVQLEKLKLEYCWGITDKDLLNLAPLVHLQELSVKDCYNVTDAGCEALKRAIIAAGGSANLKIIR